MASNDTLLIWSPLAAELAENVYPRMDFRNAHPVVDFEDAQDATITFHGVLPKSYSGNGVVVKIHWAATSATTGNVRWVSNIERIGDQVLDIDTDSWGTSVYANDDCPGTCGYVKVSNRNHDEGAEMDNLVAGELFRLKVKRESGVSDTMVGDAELLMVELREQA